jgi:hypothetical protein
MITRPLDIASHLSPPPRSFDVLFYVNVGALAVFFFLFGSRVAPPAPLRSSVRGRFLPIGVS